MSDSIATRTMHKANPPLDRHTVYAARGPFIDVTIDFLTGFQESSGYTKICVVMCAFTRYIVLYSCSDETADTAASCLDLFSSTFRCPRYLRSDQGPAFVSDVINIYCKARGIKQQLTVAHTPTSHGIVERAIQEVQRHLSALAHALGDIKQDKWTSYIHLVNGIMNQTCSYSTGFPPAAMVFGHSTFDSPQAIANLLPANFENAESLLAADSDHQNLLTALWDASTEYQDTQAIHHVMEQKAPRLVPDSFALVINNNRNNKIEPKFKGPYKVLGPRDDQNEHMYELQDMVEDQIASHHMSNIVPVDITEDIAMKTARLTANTRGHKCHRLLRRPQANWNIALQPPI